MPNSLLLIPLFSMKKQMVYCLYCPSSRVFKFKYLISSLSLESFYKVIQQIKVMINYE